VRRFPTAEGYNDYADNSNKYKYNGKELENELGKSSLSVGGMVSETKTWIFEYN